MAWPVYTRRLTAGQGLEERLVVACPAGKRWVVRDISATAGASTRIDVWIGGVGAIWVATLAGAGTEWYGRWEGRQVVNAGEEIQITATPTGAYVVVTGYEFSA